MSDSERLRGGFRLRRWFMVFAGVLGMSVATLAWGGLGTVTSVDPFLGAPILYDSGSFGTATLDATTNGGIGISAIEVLGPGAVYVTLDDGVNGFAAFPGPVSPYGDSSSFIDIHMSSGPGTAVSVSGPVPFNVNSRGYEMTLNPTSGLLGIAGADLTGPAPAPGIFEFSPAAPAAPVLYASMTAQATTSGLTYDPVAGAALLTTDGLASFASPPVGSGFYSVPAGGPEIPVAPTGPPPVGSGGFADDHVITLDGRTIVVNDGTHDLHDVTGGPGATALLVDLDTIAAVVPVLSGGGVRADVSPIDGDIFVGWGFGGPGGAGGSNLLRVDEFGTGASVALTGLENVRDIAFGPSTLAAGPGTTGVSLYLTEYEGGTGITPFSNIWEVPVLVPEPASAVLLVAGGLLLRRRR